MPTGEITVTCPHCQNRASLPISAVKRDNYYCSKCFEKIPLQGMRSYAAPVESRPAPARKSSRGYRR